jgi:beta-xylosidase
MSAQVPSSRTAPTGPIMFEEIAGQNDAYSAYIDMGLPKDLTPVQLDQLRGMTRDLPEIDRVVEIGDSGSYTFPLPMSSNDIVLVTMEKETNIHGR